MLTQTERKWFKKTIKFCSFYLLPYEWDEDNYCISLTTSPKKIVLSNAALVLQICYLAFLLGRLIPAVIYTVNDVSFVELSMLGLTAFTLGYAIINDVFSLGCREELVTLVNRL